MANYHFSVDIVKRSAGRSSVAAAAYRSGEKLIDFRTGKRYDFRHKDDVTHKTIMLPESASSWMKDRQALWNYVEQFEKRTDAQLCRDVNFDLPKELTTQQNIELAEKFAQEMFVAKGMIADLAIHTKYAADGTTLSHVHVLLTMREVSEQGFGLKNRAWNSKDLLQDWRIEWANYANHALSLNGHKERVDHRSLAEQGIALEPQNKRGNENYKFNGRRKAGHERIARDNAERILADPSIATRALTRNQSTFSTKDIHAFAKRHSANETQQAEVFQAIRNHQEIVQVQEYKDCFTTLQMLSLEMSMLSKANRLHISKGHAVKEVEVTRPLSDEQKEVLDHLVATGDMKCVIGYAGSGKSYLLGAAREAWEQSGYKVEGVTLSGIAASGLQASSGIESRTLASRMSYWDKGEEKLTKDTVLVVDEAGMLGSRQIAKILKEVEKAEAKVVFIGDTEQLQAIEAGAAFRAIVDRFPKADLTEIRRQSYDWQREATKEFGQGLTEQAIERYRERGHIKEYQTKDMARCELISEWKQERIIYSKETSIMLAYTHEDVEYLNAEARRILKEGGELGKEKEFKTIYRTSDPLSIEEHEMITEEGKRNFAINDRLLFLQNDRTLGVMNGNLGTVKYINGREMTVILDNKQEVKFDTAVYKYFDHGYATTIYKAQGVTVDSTYLLASKHLDSNASYVGMSRHKEELKVYYGQDEFSNKQELVRSMSHKRDKPLSLERIDTRLQDYLDVSMQRERLPKFSHQIQDLAEKELWKELRDKAEKLAHEIVNDTHLNKIAKEQEIYKAIERDATGYQTSQRIAQELAMHNSQDRGFDMGMGW
jgi:Ti-type conjugative transfer relaxase TraA